MKRKPKSKNVSTKGRPASRPAAKKAARKPRPSKSLERTATAKKAPAKKVAAARPASRAAAPRFLAARIEAATAPAQPLLETYEVTNRQLESVPDGFVAKGNVPIRLDWSGTAVGDVVRPGQELGHWIWQMGRTAIVAPANCVGRVGDLRDPDCDILDQPPSQVLLVLTN